MLYVSLCGSLRWCFQSTKPPSEDDRLAEELAPQIKRGNARCVAEFNQRWPRDKLGTLQYRDRPLISYAFDTHATDEGVLACVREMVRGGCSLNDTFPVPGPPPNLPVTALSYAIIRDSEEVIMQLKQRDELNVDVDQEGIHVLEFAVSRRAYRAAFAIAVSLERTAVVAAGPHLTKLLEADDVEHRVLLDLVRFKIPQAQVGLVLFCVCVWVC